MHSRRDDMEPDSTVYQTLLESTKAIPWRIDWQTMRFTYIGPQIESLLGWTPQSWVSVDDWVERMHPDDREYVVNFCVSQSQSGIDHEADYRALTADGNYVWIRDVVHVVRKGDLVEALVGFMFDITERKKNEEKLLSLQRELEALSYQDALTAIPNRRMFDVVLSREWAQARRSQLPLALIMLDIDFFKEYNDRYGHVAGDEALKRVTDCLERTIARPRDFIARYGGEEFVIVMPETDLAAAALLAERCRLAVFEEEIAHDRSAVVPQLTISLGVASWEPGQNDQLTDFINEADQRLYQAKERGRNRVEAGQYPDGVDQG